MTGTNPACETSLHYDGANRLVKCLQAALLDLASPLRMRGNVARFSGDVSPSSIVGGRETGAL